MRLLKSVKSVVGCGLTAPLVALVLGAAAPAAQAEALSDEPAVEADGAGDGTGATALDAATDTEVLTQPGDGQLQDGSDAPLPARGINRWVCFATALPSHREYYGASQWFPAGSGQGQAAHRTAYDNALTNCRRASRTRDCTSDFARDCSVQRH